jgi:hypothetical protein
MNDKEKLKILAEAIDKTDCYFTDANGRDFCLFCKCSLNTLHDLNCPVLLAEEVLKEVLKDKGTLKYLKPIVDGLRKEGAIFVPPVMCGSECTYPDGDCPHCKEGSIEPVKGTEPYSEDHLMCNKCDSTFNKEEKKPMKLYELQHYVDKLIEQGHSDTPVYFDTEAKTYDCHIVPIGSINLVPKEAMGEDYIILYEYQYTEKSEEPLIVHNVMSYKGKNYLRQLGNCTDCSIYGIECHNDISVMQFGYKTKCVDTNTIWKSFDDIQITDELACMRKDIGDIYVFNIQEDQIDKLVYVENDRDMYVHTLGWRSTNKNIRLATAEEIQKNIWR